MQNKPILSIIIPIYNVAEWLHACIESIISQNLKSWELILIDDGSSDDCGRICDSYAAKDHRIITVHQENNGVSAARNKGLDIAQGRYITFVDSDDEIGTTTTFEENIKFMVTNPDIDILQYPHSFIKNDQIINNNVVEGEIIDSAEILKALQNGRISGYIWDKIYKRELFSKIHFTEKMAFGEDTLCLINLSDSAKKIYISSKGRYDYYLRKDSATTRITPEMQIGYYRMKYTLFEKIFLCNEISDIVKKNAYFTMLKALIDTRIIYKNRINLKNEINAIREIQYNKYIRSRITSNKEKIWLILICLFGINTFTWTYATFILFKKTFNIN